MAQRLLTSTTDPAVAFEFNNAHRAIVTSPVTHADGMEFHETTLLEIGIVGWPRGGSAPSTPAQAQSFLAALKNFLNLHLGFADFSPYAAGTFAHKVPDTTNLIAAAPADWTAAETALSEATRIMVNEISTEYSAHISAPATTIHHIVDAVNYIGGPLTFTNLEWTMQKGVERINLLKALFNDHVMVYGAGDVHSASDGASVVAAANCTYDVTAGTDWGKVLTLLTEMYPKVNSHFANGTIHDVADPAVITSPLPTVPGDTYTLVDEILTDYAAHRVSTTHHYGADSTNTVATASGVTTLAGLVTAAAQLYTAVYGHVTMAPTSRAVRLYP